MSDGTGREIPDDELLEIIVNGERLDYQPTLEGGSYLPVQSYRDRMEAVAALLSVGGDRIELRPQKRAP